MSIFYVESTYTVAFIYRLDSSSERAAMGAVHRAIDKYIPAAALRTHGFLIDCQDPRSDLSQPTWQHLKPRTRVIPYVRSLAQLARISTDRLMIQPAHHDARIWPEPGLGAVQQPGWW